jgi:branched-chain amino acid transport system substrate-binding protein
MVQNKDTTTLVISLVATTGLVGAGIWWLSQRSSLFPSRLSPLPISSDRISQGEQILLPSEQPTPKQQAAEALKAGDREAARQYYAAARQVDRNDPETLIYLENTQISGPCQEIAVSVPIGTDRNGAKEILRGVAQAQTEINAEKATPSPGTIAGALKVTIVNDDNNPETARRLVQQLIQRPEILGVVGHYASTVTLATVPLYTDGRLPVISPISTTTQLSNASPYVFRTVPSDYAAARNLADHLILKLRLKKVAVFYNPQSAYSQSLSDEFKTAVTLLGGEVVSQVDLAATNFNPQAALQTAKAQGAQVLLFTGNTATISRALQVAQANQGEFPLLAGDDFYSPTTLDVGRKSVLNMVLAVPWLSDRNPTFASQARNLWRGDVNWRTATAYDATRALFAAISQSPTRTGVQQTLRSGSILVKDGALGPVRFSASGDRPIAAQLAQIVENPRSASGYSFTPAK